MDHITQDQITILAEKKLAGTISPEELSVLENWLTRRVPDEWEWDGADTDETALRNRLLASIWRDAGIDKKRGRLRRLRFAKAAAVACLVIGGALSYRYAVTKKPDGSGMAAAFASVKDLPPGHNGAILTLGNGHEIVLDSVTNGDVALQGTQRLVKRNGLLAYEKQSDRSAPPEGNLTNILKTPRGREFEIVLSDGTRVWLNAASSITYPSVFTGGERKVAVTGEAYFEVATDERHPFVVSVGSARIAVLGTHFDVMAYPDEKSVKTTLLEGSVKVISASSEVMVVPGQQAVLSPDSGRISLKKVDAAQSVAWVAGKLSLDNLGIEAIMRQVSRWYDVDVRFEGPVPQGRFWGVINRNVNLSSVLNVMNANGISARLENGDIIVSSK